MTIEGLPVLLMMPHFASAPKITGLYQTDDADVSQARRITANVWQRPLHSFGHQFIFGSRTEAADLEDFFATINGKWLQFFIPSWLAELWPVATVDAGDTTLQIASVGFPTVFDPTNSNPITLGHYIFIQADNSDIFISKVTSASTSGNVDTLTLETPAPAPFTLGRFAVGFVYCVNSTSDALVLNFDGMNKITAQLSMTEAMSITDGNGS